MLRATRPDEQAAPALTAMPARSKVITVRLGSNARHGDARGAAAAARSP
ncbi:MAG: hypothetical protein U1E43_01915 [Rhodospirillales bacterium]